MKNSRLTAVATLTAAFLLVGCSVSSPSYRDQLGDNIRLEPALDATYDYRLTLKGVIDFRYNSYERKDRVAMAEAILTPQCKRVIVLEETSIDGGTNFVGRQLITYFMKLKCER